MHWIESGPPPEDAAAERKAREASADITVRCRTLVAAKADAEKSLAEKETELQSARETIKQTLADKETLLNSQESEIDRQVQLRQAAWTDRLNQLRQELDSQRATSEAERAAIVLQNQKKLQELSEEWRTQIIQVNRQMADAELVAEEKNAKLTLELKDALLARDATGSQLQLQSESFSLKLTPRMRPGNWKGQSARRNTGWSGSRRNPPRHCVKPMMNMSAN